MTVYEAPALADPTASAAAPAAWARFADRLACPECRARVRCCGDGLRCEGDAAHRFPVTATGVPVLLREAERRALQGDLDQAVVMCRDYRLSPMQKIARTARRAIGSTLHLPVSKTVTAIWQQHRDELALEVGSGITPGRGNTVNLDIAPFRHVDVVGSALDLPFQDDSFGLLHNAAVLEHVRRPQQMIAEMHRVLRPGGHVYTEVPFLQHFHAWPNDFQRYTTEGLKQAFAAFDVLETGVCVGPSSAITALIADWCELLTFSQNRLVNDIARTVPLVLLWPLKYLDWLLQKNPRAHELASGIYLLAKKRG